MTLLLAGTASTLLQWWQTATAILSFPAVVITMVYTIMNIQKTRVDMKKAEAETAKLTKDLSDQKQELNNQRLELFLITHFLNKRQLDILSHLDKPPPSYRLNIDPGDQFLRFDLSQLLNMGLIAPTGRGWVMEQRGWQDVAEFHRITEQGRQYLTMLKAAENKLGRL